MSEDSDDKQYDASEQKLRRAREKGDIARSPELPAAPPLPPLLLA